MGRPLKFQSVEELQKAIDAYFEEMKKAVFINGDGIPIYEPLTITGLALALDTTRQGLMNYEHRDEFYDAIKKAKTRVENFAEKRLYGSNATGPIFALKNFGWDDKSQQEITGKNGGNISIETRVLPDTTQFLAGVGGDRENASSTESSEDKSILPA